MSAETITALDIIKLAATSIVSFITAYLTYKGAAKKFSQTTPDSDKEIFINSVTNERAKWRSELREAVSNYGKIATKFLNQKNNLSKLYYHKCQIITRLNPDGWLKNSKHIEDHNLISCVVEIYNICEQEKLNKFRLKSELDKLEKSAQKLLKKEWDKSKNEAKYGIID